MIINLHLIRFYHHFFCETLFEKDFKKDSKHVYIFFYKHFAPNIPKSYRNVPYYTRSVLQQMELIVISKTAHLK